MFGAIEEGAEQDGAAASADAAPAAPTVAKGTVIKPVSGMEAAAEELRAIAGYSVEHPTLAQSGFAGLPPSIHAMMLWQETIVKSIHERIKGLTEALAKGLKYADQAWPKKVRKLLEDEKSRFRLRRFPHFIDAVVNEVVAACKARDERLVGYSGQKAKEAPKLLTVAATERTRKRVSLLHRFKAAADAFVAPQGNVGGFVDEAAAQKIADDNPDALSVDRLMGVAGGLSDPNQWLESTAELRRELHRKRVLVREALTQLDMMAEENTVSIEDGVSDNEGDTLAALGGSSVSLMGSGPPPAYPPSNNPSLSKGNLPAEPAARTSSRQPSASVGLAPGSSTSSLINSKNGPERQSFTEYDLKRDASTMRSLLSGSRLLPFTNANGLTGALGKLEYARLQAVRRTYSADYKTDLRDDIKRRKFTNSKYAKLVRHFTLSRAEWAFKAFKEAQAAEKKSRPTGCRRRSSPSRRCACSIDRAQRSWTSASKRRGRASRNPKVRLPS